MKRTLIAAVWIAGSTIPLLVATVFVFGCCVLPFHGVIHKVMPFCQSATALMSGMHQHDASRTPLPPRERQEPVKRLHTELTSRFTVTADASRYLAAPQPQTAPRTFISLGATRCDRDVGWYVLVATFLL